MKKTVLLIFAAVMALAADSCSAADTPTLSVSPKNVEIGAFFDGTSLKATGQIPEGSRIALRFLGENCDIPIRRKGKVLGIMWMNLDSLVIRKVPGVCMVYNSPGGVEPAAASSSNSGAFSLAALSRKAEIECKSSNREGVFDEFLKLKESEGLYLETTGTVQYGPAKGGIETFEASIPVPARLTPGKYFVDMAVIKDGKTISRGREEVAVSLVGFPGLLSNLAFGHSAMYGILSTVIALLAGLGIGLVFQGKGSH